jgi:Mce-associated membrane protein
MAAEAEAEAAEVEAIAAAARARARAIRLRREAATAQRDAADNVDAPAEVEPPAERGAANGDGPDKGDDHEADPAEHADGDAAQQPAEDSPLAVETQTISTTSEKDAQGDTNSAESDVATGPAQTRGRRRWMRLPRRSTAAVGVAILLIAASLGASGYITWQHRHAVQERQRTAEFAAAARQGVVTLTSLDFNRAKDDVQRVIDNSTGSFRDDFQSRADDFRTVVEQSKVITQGTVNATAVASMTADSAVVLVAATSQVTSAAGAKQEPRSWRLSVTMARDGGQLKMSRVEVEP